MNELGIIDNKLWIKVRLEELDSNINLIYKFLDVQPINAEIKTTNKAPLKYELLSENKWSKSMCSSFNKWCDKKNLY